MRQVLARDGVSFHPYLTTDAISSLYQANIYARGLLTLDPQRLQPLPNMVQSWSVSTDGRTYMFRLRPDLRWSDGTRLTARDFQWTFEKASLPANRYAFPDQLKEIASYKAKDSSTLEMVLKQAACTGLYVTGAI